MAELLVELLSEEIPARMQARAGEDLKRLASEKLAAAGLACQRLDVWVTPRRLALVVEGLPTRQPDVTEEKKGPKVGAPAQATDGFLRANGLASLDEAEVRDTGKGAFYFAVRNIPGRPTAEVVPEVLAGVLNAFGWPKSMRWGERRSRWVRPLHQILAIFDGRPLAGELDLAGTGFAFQAETVGHRFLAPGRFSVISAADYKAKLEAAFVLVDQQQRRQSVVEQCSRLAHEAGLAVKPDEGLVDEVTGLVEWPVVLMGSIGADFMALPPEVLTTSMRAHQKYFALVDPAGKLADKFLVAANMEAPVGSTRRANIVSGNERVLAARLADAMFFWAQDRKRPLESRVAALKEMVFHAKLGSLEDKVERVTVLALEIAKLIPGADDPDRVRSAARLAKADLTTGMVGEFPELQGVMGRYYALNDGEPAEVAEAVADHYAPLGPSDTCPSAPVSVAVALADKIDTLVGMFAIGEKPTGSKDPFGLRRAALGIIRLVVENKLRLPLARLFAAAAEGHRGALGLSAEAVAEANAGLLDFFADRLKVTLRDQGVRHDLVAAVFAVQTAEGGAEDDLVRLLARVAALESFVESEDGANLLVAYRRAANIVRIEQKKDDRSYDGAVAEAGLVQAEEKALFQALSEAAGQAGGALANEDFTAAMAALAALRKPVDAFFDQVTVNTDEAALRENRLKLLARIGATLSEVADFSLIEG